MSPIVTLEQWIGEKKVELSRQRPLELRNISPSIRDFTLAVSTQRQQIAVIAEIARAIPEQGMLSEDLNPAALAQSLDACGVSAIAVTTDAIVCGGNYGDLQAASSAVSSPILCWDLVIDRSQLYRARLSQADGVLLTFAAVSPSELRLFLEIAASMHMAAPVEVSSAKELDVALTVGSRLIVVTAFNGSSLDLKNALTLLPKVPRNVVSIVRGPFSRPEELQDLFGLTDAIWVSGAMNRSIAVESWLKKLVDVAECGEP